MGIRIIEIIKIYMKCLRIEVIGKKERIKTTGVNVIS